MHFGRKLLNNIKLFCQGNIKRMFDLLQLLTGTIQETRSTTVVLDIP